MTIRKEHDVKTTGIADLRGYVGEKPIMYVLLVPPDREHECKLAVPKDIASKASYYMAVVEVQVGV